MNTPRTRRSRPFAPAFATVVAAAVLMLLPSCHKRFMRSLARSTFVPTYAAPLAFPVVYQTRVRTVPVRTRTTRTTRTTRATRTPACVRK